MSKARVWLIDNKVMIEVAIAIAAVYISWQAFKISKSQTELAQRQTELMQSQTEITRRQFESLKAPLLQDVSRVNQLSLLNIGGTDLIDLELVASLSANYNLSTKTISHSWYKVPDTKQVITDSLPMGDIYSVPFDKLALPVSVPNARNETNAFAVVLRYRRAADMMPYYKIVCFAKTNAGEDVYIPTVMTSPGISLGPPDDNIVPKHIKPLKDALRNLCIQNLDLPADTE